MSHKGHEAAQLAAIALWQQSGSHHWLAVTGYSMLPLFRAADQVQMVVQPRYAIGDVVVLQQGTQLLVHRLIARHAEPYGRDVWITQGDNCATPDPPVAAPQILGKVIALRRGKMQCRIDGYSWRMANLLVAFTAHFGWSRRLQRLWLQLLARLLQRQLLQPAEAPRIAQSLRPEIALLYLCTRQTLTADQQAAIGAVSARAPFDWSYLLTLAESHGVVGLLFANLQRAGLDTIALPASLRASLQQRTYRTIAVKTGVHAKLAAICAFCEEHAVDVMVLKGTALDQTVYAQPWYVEHDVDLLLRPHPHPHPHPQTTLSLAARVAAIDRYFWTLPGFEYEFDTHHDLTMNGLLAIDVDDLWRNARPIAIGGQRAWVMCPEDLLLAACINACRKRFFHLKSLLAIATLIEKYPDLCWDTLATKARRYDVAAIVYSALCVVQQTLGATLPARLAQQLHLPQVRITLISHVVRYLLAQELPCVPSAAKQPRPPDRFLLLPYAVYPPRQLVRKVRQWITRT